MKLNTLRTMLLLGTALVARPLFADEAPAADASRITSSALIETGIMGNPAGPAVANNYGQLFTDKPNQVVLNQAMLTLNRDLDPKAEGYDWGFKLQGFYGADARYTHFIGLWDHNTSDRNQFDIVEANALLHAPVLTDGGIDLKVGAYSTPIGYEVIQSNLNPLYSHSYIFNYGIPLKHTGGLSVTHVNDMLDIWLGVDSGINTTLDGRGDPNGGVGGIAGFGLNGLMDGKLTVLTLTHFGPGQPSLRTDQTAGVKGAVEHGRYIADSVITYKHSDALTFITELNYIQDDLGWGTGNSHGPAQAGGVAQYVTYALNDTVTLVGRGELFADPKNYFVAGFRGNNDFVGAERGTNYVSGSTSAVSTLAIASPSHHGTTYGALTLGADVKIPGLPERFDGTMLRPEIRYDGNTEGLKAFNYKDVKGTATAQDQYQFTIGMDLVIPVSLF
jgi:hypothetical protein